MQFQQSPNPLGLDRFRGVINGFVAGLVVGAFLGWFFHGFVGLLIRFGFVLILLIPIAIVVWYFFLRRPGAGPGNPTRGPGGMQMYTWSSERVRQRPAASRHDAAPSERGSERPNRSARDNDVIDIEFEELRRQLNDEERRP